MACSFVAYNYNTVQITHVIKARDVEQVSLNVPLDQEIL